VSLSKGSAPVAFPRTRSLSEYVGTMIDFPSANPLKRHVTVDNPHAAATDLRENSAVGECPANHGGPPCPSEDIASHGGKSKKYGGGNGLVL